MFLPLAWLNPAYAVFLCWTPFADAAAALDVSQYPASWPLMVQAIERAFTPRASSVCKLTISHVRDTVYDVMEDKMCRKFCKQRCLDSHPAARQASAVIWMISSMPDGAPKHMNLHAKVEDFVLFKVEPWGFQTDPAGAERRVEAGQDFRTGAAK
jgi:hypothetical protein